MLGVITILWNRQESSLRRMFIWILRAKSDDYAAAIWDRYPTHKARRDALEMAIDNAKLTKRQKGILRWVIDQTKTMADRRNELIHAEYVVGNRSEKLHAKVKPPNAKGTKHQRVSASDLRVIIRDLDFLVEATETAVLEFYSRKLTRVIRDLDQLAKEREQPA
jgi:hypothetical protein